MKRPLALLAVALLLAASCGDDARQAPKRTFQDVDPDGIKAKPGDPDLVYQYYDDECRPHVATDPAKIPEKNKKNVMLMFSGERRKAIPADALVLADLTSLKQGGCYDVKVVNRFSWRPAGMAQPQAESKTTSLGGQVALYTAPGCPHCERARSWLKKNSVPFVEKDVSADPDAAREIATLGRQQGIPDSYLSSVPLLLVNGKVLVGFSADEVKRALGM